MFDIPNEASTPYSDLAEMDSVDLDILVAALNGDGVITGFAVTPQGSPDMTVAVAIGSMAYSGTRYNIAGANVTITAADATNPRIDMVCATSAGTLVARAGTPAAQPVTPTLSAGDIALAQVYVPALITTIDSTRIVDKRAPVKFMDRVRAYKSADVAIASGSDVVTTFDSESTDTNTMHSTSANTGRLTFTEAGFYDVDGYLDTNTSGVQLTKIRLNGTTVLKSDVGKTCRMLRYFSAADYVELLGNVTVSATIESDTTYFAAHRVS